MTIKDYLKSKEFWIINLIIIIAGILALTIFLYLILPIITRADDIITVPKVEGKKLPQALKILKQKGFKVDVDSTFTDTCPPLQVLIQNPKWGKKAKPNRTIYITVNQKTPPKIPTLPYTDFIGGEDYQRFMQDRGFKIERVDTVFNKGVDNQVVKVLYQGKPIKNTGDSLPQGASIIIVVNKNKIVVNKDSLNIETE